jgi:hypothetical protein
LIFLGLVLLVLIVSARRKETIRLVVKKKPREIQPILGLFRNFFQEAHEGLQLVFGLNTYWKIGSILYGVCLVTLLAIWDLRDVDTLFTPIVILWFLGGLAGLILLYKKGYGVGTTGCGCLMLGLELLGGELTLLGIIPLAIFGVLGPFILIFGLLVKPRSNEETTKE